MCFIVVYVLYMDIMEHVVDVLIKTQSMFVIKRAYILRLQ